MRVFLYSAKRRVFFVKALVPVLLLLGIVLFASCQKRRILSQQAVADIMVELYLADEFIKRNEDVNRMADSVLIYDAVFRKFGSSLEEYQRSVTYYVSSDKKFPEIARMAYDKVHSEAQRLKKMSGFRTSNFLLNRIYPVIHFPDSLSVREDSLALRKFWMFNFNSDTLKFNITPLAGGTLSASQFNNSGEYIGDPSKIIDDSDAAIIPDEAAARVNPADRPRDNAREAQPLTKEQLQERQKELQQRRERIRKDRVKQQEIEQIRRGRGYE